MSNQQSNNNAGHFRNNTGTDLEYEEQPSIKVPYGKHTNLSQDIPLGGSLLKYASNQEESHVHMRGSANLEQNKMRSHDSLDMSSSVLYSKGLCTTGIRSRSTSPIHNRTVSYLNDLGFTNEVFVNPMGDPMMDDNRISEERKSDEETGHSGSLQALEELLAPILSDSKKSENSLKSDILKFKKQALSDNKRMNSNQNLLTSKVNMFLTTERISRNLLIGQHSLMHNSKNWSISNNKSSILDGSKHIKSSSDDFGKPILKPTQPKIGYFNTKKLVEKEETPKLMSKKEMILYECMQDP
jgi:hypothetical protein